MSTNNETPQESAEVTPSEDAPVRIAPPLAATITISVSACGSPTADAIIERVCNSTGGVVTKIQKSASEELGLAQIEASLAIPYPVGNIPAFYDQALADAAAAEAAKVEDDGGSGTVLVSQDE